MQLNQRVYEAQVKSSNPSQELPEKVLQFGEGNFLRGFVDWMIQEMNKQGLFNGRVVAIQPTPHGKVVPKLNAQNGLYTYIQKGIHNGETIDDAEVITSISRGINPYQDWDKVLEVAASPDIEVVFSNTTEAGLVYEKEPYEPEKAPLSFPGKLALALHHRYLAKLPGWLIVPCELVDNNGEFLQSIVVMKAKDWELSEDFVRWVQEENQFCNTLVDRIVPGYPRGEETTYEERLGYSDKLVVIGEPYHLFAIEGDEKAEQVLPFVDAGLNVKWGDVAPQRTIKVKLLNGPHTMLSAVGYLAGVDTVGEAMRHPVLRPFVENALSSELIPAFDFDEQEKQAFAQSVIERFENPFTQHYLTDIGMNATQKWKSRLLPSLFTYVEKEQQVPPLLALSFAAQLLYGRPVARDGAFLTGKRENDLYQIRDQDEAIALFEREWSTFDIEQQSIDSFVQNILAEKDVWGSDLNEITGWKDAVVSNVTAMLQEGVLETISQHIGPYSKGRK
ncbi:tagaturonate reductase [Aureibacillus halotolerans]|uniref:Tagaturonate reductase n=1 Tax=Aureibacillus halotolerans TaxID=1508390 RepID=A0A4R6U8M0_9BACI|nr:tagaturonate reductase [Aureibacillus halotolerans]TDQ42930.1 tagaturonate reductase [Aureibacillus halotolerans]